MENKIIALGYFDSIHIGHAALLKRAVALAGDMNCTPAALLLYGETGDVFPLEERIRRIKNIGISEVISFELNDKLKSTSAENFIEKLAKSENVVGFVCGEDFTYGNGAKGNADTLKTFCNANNIVLEVVKVIKIAAEPLNFTDFSADASCNKTVKNGNKKVSTTLIKGLLKSGKIELSNELLSEPYSISGTVAHGNAIGRTIGFPTANVKIETSLQHLADGVYKGECVTENGTYKAIINYGFKPTVDGNAYGAEAYLKDFSDNIYGKPVRLVFKKFLREIRKFSSLDELKSQLLKDKESLND